MKLTVISFRWSTNFLSICPKLFDYKSDDFQAVFVARFTQDFGKCLGIEILQSLHEQGMKVVDR